MQSGGNVMQSGGNVMKSGGNVMQPGGNAMQSGGNSMQSGGQGVGEWKNVVGGFQGWFKQLLLFQSVLPTFYVRGLAQRL